MTFIAPLREARCISMDMRRKDSKSKLIPGALLEVVVPAKGRLLSFRSDHDLWYQDRGTARARMSPPLAIPFDAHEWHHLPISGVLEDQTVYFAATQPDQVLYLRVGGK